MVPAISRDASFDTTIFAMDTFHMVHRPIVYFLYQPQADEFLSSRPRALWKWALDAVLAQVKARRLDWNTIRDRRDQRRRYIHLVNLEITQSWRMKPAEEAEYAQLVKTIHPDDLRFWRSLAGFMRRREIVHWYPFAFIMPCH
jgi:hypothetical protein